MSLTPSPISCLLRYYQWRLTLFQGVPLGLGPPLLAMASLQFSRTSNIHQLRNSNVFFDLCYQCHLYRWPRNATERTRTYPTAQVVQISKAPLVVCRDHCMKITWRLAACQLEVAAISHPPYLYLATTPAPPSPHIPPELLTLNARRAGTTWSILM
jgi:hypothetical protein